MTLEQQIISNLSEELKYSPDLKWLKHSGISRKKKTIRRWKHNFIWWHRNGRHHVNLKMNNIFNKIRK